MISGVAARPRTLRYRLDSFLRERDRRAGKYDRTLRFRDVVLGAHGANDWGHRLMALVGTRRTGSFEPPRVRDLYFREVYEYPVDEIERLRAGEPVKPTGRRFEVTRDAMHAWDGVRGKRGRTEEWRTFDSQDDGHTIRVGWLGSDGRLHDSGINGDKEIALFRRWLLWDDWVKARWCGLRPWLYYKGLHAAVNRKYPFTCQATPPPGTGGYSHWYCTVRVGLSGTLRRWLGQPVEHPMPHRYINYRWDGEGNRVDYDPQDGQR